MKLSDYVADFIANLTGRVYMVCGAGAMHLNDSICHHSGIKAIAMHHEQAAAFAAEAEARVTNNIAVVHVTSGPGVTNTVTGLACAWADSIPMLVIAGQVESRTLMQVRMRAGRKTGDVRQNGISEVDAVSILEPITKYAYTVTAPQTIRYHLEKAVAFAMSGRRGPVFIEIPLDVQNAEIDPEGLEQGFVCPTVLGPSEDELAECVSLLEAAKRPVLIIGNGVRFADAEMELRHFINMHRMPVIASWNARDIIPDHELFIGSCGLFGDRASNWTVQNADLVLAVGTRLTYPQTGHHRHLFAPNAKKIVVDIDYNEAAKLQPDCCIVADCKAFLSEISKRPATIATQWKAHSTISWLTECQVMKARYPVVLPEYAEDKGGINVYHFLEQLGEHLDKDAIIVTDVGFAFVCTHQALPLKQGQRLFHSPGIAPMGYGLPAAIGAAFATGCKRQIICICGDGGIMFNLQELATIAHHKLPISIFVYANDGYATMRATQGNHFGRLSTADRESGVSFPEIDSIAEAFGILCGSTLRLEGGLDWILKMRSRPMICQLRMAPNQAIAPRVQSRMENGKFVPTPIDHMWPVVETAEAAE